MTASDSTDPPAAPHRPSAAGDPFAAAPRVDVSRLDGRLLDGRYQMVKKVGEGGMALVYLAVDRETGRQVAIKILLPALLEDRTSIARLRREADLAGRLDHPNVCHVMRLGETPDGFDYAVMPYLDGVLLCDRVASSGQLSLEVTARYVRDMCAGLDVAHKLGIVHRDLKPENVMIVRQPDGSERAVVMDFSLATAAHVKTLTAAGLVVGTPEFMSPEQLRDQELDPRSDVYSLAFMTYEMLTGKLPFDGDTPYEIMIARLKGDSIPICSRRPDLNIPIAVERVLSRALALDPDARYPNVHAFGVAFTRAAMRDTWLKRALRALRLRTSP